MQRYNRNVLIEKIGAEGQKKISRAKVLVCGAGGLGSGVLLNLAALGVGHIGIIDCDTVELSNLNRQYIHKESSIGISKVDSAKKQIEEFNSEIAIKTYNIKLDQENIGELFSDYNIITDCFDNFYSKFILSDFVVKTEKILVHGGVEEFSGQVSVIKKNSACLACFMPELYNISDDLMQKKGIISPVVSTIASIQATEIFKIITGVATPLINTVLFYNALEQSYKKVSVQKNKNCPICSKCANYN